MEITLTSGFAPEDRDAVVALYWQGFAGKLSRVMGPDAKALDFIRRVVRTDHVICAYRGADLLGVAGYKTPSGSFVSGGFDDMVAVYGPLGAVWRSAALALLERDVDNDRFLMDGLVVAAQARGLGVGTRLLGAICDEARRRGYGAVRLDVIDSNPRAKALYEREGFVSESESGAGIVAPLFGFRSATTMVKTLPPAGAA